ncbi:MAG: WecB/TagA/CpsF family glycosyltransferase [Leeuwenhoekiella sp.]
MGQKFKPNKELRWKLLVEIIEKLSIRRNAEEVFAHISSSIADKPYIISFVNAHGYNLCWDNKEFANCLLNSDLVLRDGAGMEILLKFLRLDPGENLNGTDFIPLFVKHNKDKKLAVFGTNNPYLENAIIKLKIEGYNVIVNADGFREFREYIKLLKKHKPDIILLGMGMPRQEKLSIIIKESLDFPCVVINGGAIIDFLGNKFNRAPLWMRNGRIEWMYRFWIEPERLFVRYMNGSFIFFRRMVRLKKIHKSSL